MKKTALLVFIFFVLNSLSKAKTIDTLGVRTMFYNSVNSSGKTDDFLKYLQASKENEEGIIIGYTGMAHLLLAKHGFNPYTQLKEFYKGRDLLEKAIKTDSKNVELRFLRLSVQSNAPFFLNYNDKIAEDKKMILENYSKLQDTDLKSRIKNFFIDSNLLFE